MKRRDFIALLGAAAGWPLAGNAQQPERMRRIGALINFAEGDPETKARVAAFRQGLERRGWSEDRNVHVDYRFAAAKAERIPAFAKELSKGTPVSQFSRKRSGFVRTVSDLAESESQMFGCFSFGDRS